MEVTAKLPHSWKKAMKEASPEDQKRLSKYLDEAEEQFNHYKPDVKSKWAYIADIALRRFHHSGGPAKETHRKPAEKGLPVASGTDLTVAAKLIALAKSLLEQ